MRIDSASIFVIIASWMAILSVTFITLAFMERNFWFMVCGLLCIPVAFNAIDVVCKIKNERRK